MDLLQAAKIWEHAWGKGSIPAGVDMLVRPHYYRVPLVKGSIPKNFDVFGISPTDATIGGVQEDWSFKQANMVPNQPRCSRSAFTYPEFQAQTTTP